jgi:pimeloyl-ACP methyl ester carboxylesterase
MDGMRTEVQSDMTEPPTHRFRARDGAELAYREIGDGRPFVLLHGFTGSGLQWVSHGHAETIAKRGHRVILPDMRGHGDSDRPHDPAAFPPDILADDTRALIEQLGLDGYDLGGYSLGGTVVVRALARGAQPGRAIVAGQGLGVITGTTSRGGAYRGILAALARGDVIEPGSPEAEQAYWITQGGGDPQSLLHVLDSLVATPESVLHQIMTPTLVVVGDQDGRHASADALAAALPDARFARVPGNHVTALAAPELEAAILDFLG